MSIFESLPLLAASGGCRNAGKCQLAGACEGAGGVSPAGAIPAGREPAAVGMGTLVFATASNQETEEPESGTTGGKHSALLESPEHVLSTLESDGSRRWLRPKLSPGKWWQRRRIVAYLLMIVFVVIPHLRLAGKPLILLDIAEREFTILGRTFLPTDTLLLALLMLSVFVSIVLITAVAGRAWCGWACPQTVYMEFLFRPVDRLFDNTVGKGGKPRRDKGALLHIARFVVYALLCMFLAHTFLAYFVGTEKLAMWVRSTPAAHPVAFLVMSATLGLMLFDFMFFREQLCLIACPYGRFQSVMLDQQSTIVAYDYVRGEPRKKGKREPLPVVSADGRASVTENRSVGDCVDCNQCVVVCPTGIDIRDGLQMECINCTQCIDACDEVMDRVGLPKGLIRYGSQDSIAGKAKRLLRARTMIYPVILLALFGALLTALVIKSGFDARVIRGKGAPYTIYPDRTASNEFQLRLVNRTDEPQHYEIIPPADESIKIEVLDQGKMTLEGGGTELVPLHVTFPSNLTRGIGRSNLKMTIRDGEQRTREVQFFLLGPR
ncbi:cytochrome c oxidase accessory protein CcoG [Stieleria varia]|uniref:4Fe-4S binding domain protein n=1 Tax=Stieleria varia TaxID=2528005 RepID=A0A5C6ATW0_9BACT|nr:cytochrome c oxidase accessory protein CcoG [Stieleria varia]TWU02452.1 4Fe-4S binding domain protein [Stieleria varia]